MLLCKPGGTNAIIINARDGPIIAIELNNRLTFVVDINRFFKIMSAMADRITAPKYLNANGSPDNNPIAFISIPRTSFIYLGVYLSKVDKPHELPHSEARSAMNGTDVKIDLQGTEKVLWLSTESPKDSAMYSFSSTAILGCLSGVSNTNMHHKINQTKNQWQFGKAKIKPNPNVNQT